jgi:hypothetical protein
MVQVKAGLTKLTAAPTYEAVMSTLKKLTGNPYFDNLPYPVTQLESEAETMLQYDQAVREGHKGMRQLRDEALKNLRAKMKFTADHVNMKSEGNLLMLESSGFPFVKSGQSPTLPGLIEKISSKIGADDGSVKLNWSGSAHKSFYIVEYTSDPAVASSWKQINQVSKNYCTLQGLTSGQNAFFRVRGVNSLGSGEWSDITKVMVA